MSTCDNRDTSPGPRLCLLLYQNRNDTQMRAPKGNTVPERSFQPALLKPCLLPTNSGRTEKCRFQTISPPLKRQEPDSSASRRLFVQQIAWQSQFLVPLRGLTSGNPPPWEPPQPEFLSCAPPFWGVGDLWVKDSSQTRGLRREVSHQSRWSTSPAD